MKTLAAALTLALSLSVDTALAAPRAGIILYQNDNFGGDSRILRDDIANLDRIHFGDRVSSVEVRRGVWELCERPHYRGRCITVDHDIAKLSRLHFDDRTSSVRRID